MALYDRYVRLELYDDNDVERFSSDQIRIGFEVKRQVASESQAGHVAIWNLSARTASQVVANAVSLRLYAGYRGSGNLIVYGAVRRDEYERKGLDRIAKLYVGEVSSVEIGKGERGGNRGKGLVRISESEPIELRKLVRRIVGEMGGGVVTGNLSTVPDEKVLGYWSGWRKPEVLLNGLLRGRGVEWTNNNGVIEFYRSGMPIEIRGRRIPLVSPQTGMVSSPTIVRTMQDGQDGLRVVSLLRPDIALGSAVQIESESAEGIYIVTALVQRGDSREGVFQTEMDLREPYEDEEFTS